MQYMEEDAYRMASADRVAVLLQISFECISISGLDDVHAHVVQGLDGFINRAMLLVIVCIAEPVRHEKQ